jgi:hypothetical protein
MYMYVHIGDIPTPRSGHAVACYGKYMLLYGGIDFTEEACYNDLYILDTGDHLHVHVCVYIRDVHIYIHHIWLSSDMYMYKYV